MTEESATAETVEPRTQPPSLKPPSLPEWKGKMNDPWWNAAAGRPIKPPAAHPNIAEGDEAVAVEELHEEEHHDRRRRRT